MTRIDIRAGHVRVSGVTVELSNTGKVLLARFPDGIARQRTRTGTLLR